MSMHTRRNQTGDISTLKGSSLKLVDEFTNLGSSVSSTETDINTPLAKACTANDSLSDMTDKIKPSFLQAAVVSTVLYGCTTWMLTTKIEKKLDSNYARMLQAILNESWWQHPSKQQLYSHPSRKLFKLDEQDIRDTTGGIRTSS